jgi:hypothetical protein
MEGIREKGMGDRGKGIRDTVIRELEAYLIAPIPQPLSLSPS